MTRLEDLLRDSLNERAHDVSSTPALWDRVQARTTARTQRTWALAAAGTAMAVAAGAFVVPGLLDTAPERRPILIDPSPAAPDDQPTPDAGPTPGGSTQVADPRATHAVAVVDGMLHWFDLDDDSGRHVLAHAPGSPVGNLAVQPRLDGEPWHVAYTTTGFDGEFALNVVVVPDENVRNGSVSGIAEVGRSAFQPAEAGDLPPGLAWSPDGEFLAWLRHDGDATSVEVFEVTFVDGLPEFAAVPFTTPDGGLLADGATAGELTLADWTWDALYEDGVRGRLLLTGNGRSWQAGIGYDPGGFVEVDALEQIDVAGDLAAGGPMTGPLALRLDGIDGPIGPATFAIDRADTGERVVSWNDGERAGIRPAFANMDGIGDDLVVSIGSALVFFADDGERKDMLTIVSDATIGAVSLSHAPWTAPFVSEDSDTPTRPTDQTMSPPPALAVRAVDGRLQVVDNWFGEGDPAVVRDLGLVPAFEADSPIHGVSVRPGSTLDDLEVVVLALNEGLYEFWWVRSTGEGDAQWKQFPFQYQPVAAAGDDLIPIPVFSPDHPSGDRYLAWVDHNEGGDQTVRFVGWTAGEGPGTGDPADDNTAFAVPERQLLQLDAWEWTRDVGDGWTTAQLTFTSWDEQGQSSALINDFDRGPDGAISQGDDCFCGEPGHGSHTHESVHHAPTGWSWGLMLNAGGVGLYGHQQGRGVENGGEVLPPALRDHPRPEALELRAWGDTVIVLDTSTSTVWVLRNGSLDTFAAEAFDFLG